MIAVVSVVCTVVVPVAGLSYRESVVRFLVVLLFFPQMGPLAREVQVAGPPSHTRDPALLCTQSRWRQQPPPTAVRESLLSILTLHYRQTRSCDERFPSAVLA